MPKFAYKARDERGQPVTGAIEAANREEALSKLRLERKTVTDLGESAAPVDTEHVRTKHAANSVKREEVISFASQMSVMLETGVPISEALGAFIESSRSGSLKRVMTIVHESVHAGGSFSSSLARFPKAFPSLMTSLVTAAEASGSLGLMLQRVADYLGKERRTVKQITGALAYPMIMVSMAFLVTIFLVIWVLPRFAKIYESRAAALPRPTRIVMAFSNAFTNHWVELAVGVVCLVIAAIAVRATKRGKRAIDWAKLHAPIVGPMFTQFYLTRATRTLATLLASGVALVEALRIVRGVTSNALWTDLWDHLIASITSGHTMAEVVTKSELIPAPVASMLAAAERTGKLPETLDRIADSAEHDLDEAIKSGTQMIEPLMIMCMGGLIGGIAIALLLPIFTISKVMAN